MDIDIYLHCFGFKERPFSLSPDPNMLFWSNAHRRAFAVLEYGLMTRAPLTVVTGEVGSGKTTLIQALLQKIDESVTLGLISNAQGDRGDLIRWVLNSLNVPIPMDTDYVTLFQHFQNFVISEYAAGRHVAIIIDEAQNLGPEMLEELRMLTNINSGKDELLQLILCGQPELREMITRPELRQFAQRVTATYHINPFNLDDTCAYIQHRLIHAGGRGDEVGAQACALIYQISNGVPRIINKICDLAFVYAASSDMPTVTAKTVQEVIDDGLVLQTRPRPDVFYLSHSMRRYEEAAE